MGPDAPPGRGPWPGPLDHVGHIYVYIVSVATSKGVGTNGHAHNSIKTDGNRYHFEFGAIPDEL
jgi:hypothetical protein